MGKWKIALEQKIELGEDDLWKTWNEYFEDLYNMDTEAGVTVNMGSFEGTRRGKFFGGGGDDK